MHRVTPTPIHARGGGVTPHIHQSAGEIIFLSSADSDLRLLAMAARELKWHGKALRLGNYMHVAHADAVDDYVAHVAAHAELMVVRLLGGVASWRYGVERLVAVAQKNNTPLILLSGEASTDQELAQHGTVAFDIHKRMGSYLHHGGADNARAFLRYGASLIKKTVETIAPPQPLPKAGVFYASPQKDKTKNVFIIVYGALVKAGDIEALRALIGECERHKMRVHALYVSSLKDSGSISFLKKYGARHVPSGIITMTGFAAFSFGDKDGGVLGSFDVPILQAIASSETREAWQERKVGLMPKDIAMHVALPEVDGRIIASLVSHKAQMTFDEQVECHLTHHAPYQEGITRLARMLAAWIRLRSKKKKERRIAIILSNYPNQDGRIGNGVGLDTPASLHHIARLLQKEGYDIKGLPPSGKAMIDLLIKSKRQSLSPKEYEDFFAQLANSSADKMRQKWGEPNKDCLNMRACLFGKLAVAIQPARGESVVGGDSTHDMLLPPPHDYYAFYLWLRHVFGADVVIHLGKHGTMEWLPGKGVALSPKECFPALMMEDCPHLYPFIVNDPGEGSQAKRRAAAVILDHMTPPMMTSELYGELSQLEALADEYEQAAHLDPQRLPLLKRQMDDLARKSGILEECEGDDLLGAIDAHLCLIKETQIRGGLHVYGKKMADDHEEEHLYALTRLARGTEPKAQSLIHALARDLSLTLDIFSQEPHAPFDEDKEKCPQVLLSMTARPCRRVADVLERIRLLACALIAGRMKPAASWHHSKAVLAGIEADIRPLLHSCQEGESFSLLHGVAGGFIPSGAAGAPSRGRLDAMPTGRNFYSLDPRGLPTKTAYQLGKLSAQRLIDDYRTRHGCYPKQLALSVWGTSNMRTGGEDIAQALAFIGVAPRWHEASQRMESFEIIPRALLGRPRIDVLLRISGFFRDAFGHIIHLFDDAMQTLADMDEEDNPIKAHGESLMQALAAGGMNKEDAQAMARLRVFSAKPQNYGAGLQDLIASGAWQERSDLAKKWIMWGAYGYGRHHQGVRMQDNFKQQLARVEAVVHNQDNREHDILDSDDYYQFAGGMSAAVEWMRGQSPDVYHNDHSNPDNPVIAPLSQELARIVRARAVNPKWIERIMAHGYKGAFEMAATVDYLFAFAATTNFVKEHHFRLVFDAYLGDEKVRAFIKEHNPDALHEMAARFDEAIRRGLWTPHSNRIKATLDSLTSLA